MPRARSTTSRIGGAALGVALTTGLLFGLWVMLSDKRDAFHLSAGIGSALLVAAHSHGLLAIGLRRTRRGRVATEYVFSFRWHRLLVLFPWALWKIADANVKVAWLILHPRLPIDPEIIRIASGLRRDLSRTAAAMLITLTPGTCVLALEDDVLVIHRIHPASAKAIATDLIGMIRWTFEPRSEECLPRHDEDRDV